MMNSSTAAVASCLSICILAVAGHAAETLTDLVISDFVKGQTEPALQGFVAGQRWRSSWKTPQAERPEHGKREIPTAVFTLAAEGPAQLVYVVMPYPEETSPLVEIESTKTDDGSTNVRLSLPNGIVDEIHLGETARVIRTPKGGKAAEWASLGTKP